MFVPSSDESSINSDDATTSSDSHDQGRSQPVAQRGRRLGARQEDTAQQRPVSQSCQLVDESQVVLRSSQGQMSRGRFSKFKDLDSEHSESKREKMNGALKNSYRELLNETIKELMAHSKGSDWDMVSSQIGATFWHSWEKNAFFQQLAVAGPHDLPSLSRAVPTKSESEIQYYIRLLQEATVQPSAPDFVLADASAASEISEACEKALERAAEALETHVDKHEAHLEQQRYEGGYWRVDEHQAEEIERLFTHSRPAMSANAPEAAEQPAGSFDDHHEVGGSSTLFSDPVVTLLRPASFLELSRQFYMNSSADDALNYHHHTSASAQMNGPAIYRSALEEFHNLTISISRRLVQATIFQAMSRLRAQDSSRSAWTPADVIRRVDVNTASTLLKLPSWRDYWPKVARRCQVEVYTDSKRYADGRPETKVGIRGRLLSYDEVEAELSLETSTPDLKTKPDQNSLEIDAADVEYAMDNDWLFTDSSAGDLEDDNADIDKHMIHDPSGSQARKRKRSCSPSSFYRIEERYLQALDQNAATKEEQRLWVSLGHKSKAGLVGTAKLPASPGPIPIAEKGHNSWNFQLEHESEWERRDGRVPAEQFREVELRGKVGRKRRRLLMTEIEKRLGADNRVLNQDFPDVQAESEVRNGEEAIQGSDSPRTDADIESDAETER